MRKWMFGNVDAWIAPGHKDRRRNSFFEAYGSSHGHMWFLFVYEDGKLVAVKDLHSYIHHLCKVYDRSLKHARLGNGDEHFHGYWLMNSNPALRKGVEKDIIKLLNLEEKTNDQSD